VVLVAFELQVAVSVRTCMWVGPRVHVGGVGGVVEGRGGVSGLVDFGPCCVCRCFETFDAVTVTSKEDRMSLLKVMESCKTQQEKGVLVLV